MTVAAIKIDAKGITREALTIPVDYASAAVIPAGTVLDSQHAVDSLLATLGAASFKYLQDVLDATPRFIAHAITINLAAGVHRPRAADSGADGVWKVQQRVSPQPYSETNARITIKGAASSLWTPIVSTQTVTANQAGSNDPYIDVAGTPFVAGAHKGHFAVLSTGQVAVIHDNTTSRLYLLPAISPALTNGVSTVTVARPSTILRNSLDDATSFNGSGLAPCVHAYGGNTPIALEDVQIDQFGAYAAFASWIDALSTSRATRVLVDQTFVKDSFGFAYSAPRGFQISNGSLVADPVSVRSTTQAAVPSTHTGLPLGQFATDGSAIARRSYFRGGDSNATVYAQGAGYTTLGQCVVEGARGIELEYEAQLLASSGSTAKNNTCKGQTVNAGIQISHRAFVRPVGGKFQFDGVTGVPCVKVKDEGVLDLLWTGITAQALENGAAANTDVGIEVADAAIVRLPSTTTVSGTAGQVRANGAIKTYAQIADARGAGPFAGGLSGVALAEIVEDGTAVGNGTVAFTLAGTLLAYTAPGDSAGASVAAAAPGTYLLASANGKKARVVLLAVPGGDTSDTFPISKAAVRTVGGGSIYRA